MSSIVNTRCERCIFSNPVSSGNPCENKIIEYIKETKKLKVINDFYSIEQYSCKMGFSRDIYEKNKQEASLSEIKQKIVEEACIKYYLIMDITECGPKDIKTLCKKLLSLDIKPAFISFIMFPDESNKKKIETLKKYADNTLMWKAHSFIENISIDDAIHASLDTNFYKNDSRFILIYDPQDISELNLDINTINSEINIMQKFFHYGKKKKRKKLNGLFIHFDNYQTCRSIDKNITTALTSIPEAVIYSYGK